MAKKKNKLSALYAIKNIAKKKGNIRQYNALDKKVKKLERKRK